MSRSICDCHVGLNLLLTYLLTYLILIAYRIAKNTTKSDYTLVLTICLE